MMRLGRNQKEFYWETSVGIIRKADRVWLSVDIVERIDGGWPYRWTWQKTYRQALKSLLENVCAEESD
jgi:hypothetical protein